MLPRLVALGPRAGRRVIPSFPTPCMTDPILRQVFDHYEHLKRKQREDTEAAVRKLHEPPGPLHIRQNKHGEYMQPVHPLVSKHRSYTVAVRTAKRRAVKT